MIWIEPWYVHLQLNLFGYSFAAALSLHYALTENSLFRCQWLILSVLAPDERELVFDCDWGIGYYRP